MANGSKPLPPSPRHRDSLRQLSNRQLAKSAPLCYSALAAPSAAANTCNTRGSTCGLRTPCARGCTSMRLAAPLPLSCPVDKSHEGDCGLGRLDPKRMCLSFGTIKLRGSKELMYLFGSRIIAIVLVCVQRASQPATAQDSRPEVPPSWWCVAEREELVFRQIDMDGGEE